MDSWPEQKSEKGCGLKIDDISEVVEDYYTGP